MIFEYGKQYSYFGHNWPTLQLGLFAIAELLVLVADWIKAGNSSCCVLLEKFKSWFHVLLLLSLSINSCDVVIVIAYILSHQPWSSDEFITDWVYCAIILCNSVRASALQWIIYDTFGTCSKRQRAVCAEKETSHMFIYTSMIDIQHFAQLWKRRHAKQKTCRINAS